MYDFVYDYRASPLAAGSRLQSRGLESLTAGLQSLRLASRLKPWLRTIGLGWLMAAIATACGYKQEN